MSQRRAPRGTLVSRTRLSSQKAIESLLARFTGRQATVGVIGLGYVGLPLVRAFGEKGFPVIGFDIDPSKVKALNAGQSYIRQIPGAAIKALRGAGNFRATADFAELKQADAILICVPTPLTRQREPDVSYIVDTTEVIAKHLRPLQLVVLESTTYPGTTTEVMRPILERGGLRSGRDFYLAYSPEREDPGNPRYGTATIPKVVGGDGATAAKLARALYDQAVAGTVGVSSCETAEAVKLTENIFRSVNIALVNELKVIFERMGIDVWEVIEAAKSKPFGYMPFYPGPGLGGHCIPIDPFYLTWKAREFEVTTRFIELAGEINTAMPRYVVDRLAEALDRRHKKALNGAKILLVGMAYKKNVEDIRESPAFKLIELLEARGAEVAFYDPFVPAIPRTREHAALSGRRSVAWSPRTFRKYDAALICTDHDGVDYAALVANSRLVIDTRNAANGVADPNGVVVKA
jgi:UDP-N-acetyl-D-glucosamine dehydrogenase